MTTKTTQEPPKRLHEIDPHGLRAAGAELATIPELASMMGVSSKVLRKLLGGKLYKCVRFIHPAEGAWLYSVEDVRREVEPLRPWIAARRRAADERQAAEMAAAKARREARGANAGPPKRTPAPRPSASVTPPPCPSRAPAPAVYRRGAR